MGGGERQEQLLTDSWPRCEVVSSSPPPHPGLHSSMGPLCASKSPSEASRAEEPEDGSRGRGLEARSLGP